MSETQEFPFMLDNTFFSKLYFERGPNMPGEIKVETNTEVSVAEQLPNPLQMVINIKSPDSSPLKIDLQVISLFKYIGKEPERDQKLIDEFITVQGFLMTWSSIQQAVRMITSVMGMNPLNLPMNVGLTRLEKQADE